jgi:hypothetical protein
MPPLYHFLTLSLSVLQTLNPERCGQAMRTHTRMSPLSEFFQGFTDDDAVS